MKRAIPIILAVVAIALVAMASIRPERINSAATAESAVKEFFTRVQSRDWDGAFSLVNPAANVDKGEFVKELNGREGSLRTYSALGKVETRVLRETENEALVRANLTWSTAVGAFYESRDVRAVKRDGGWKLDWTVEKAQSTPPQVIPVNYLRWDIVRGSGGDEFGQQNVEAPKVRIVSMNAEERDGNVVIMGEIINEDTVPGFVAINATLFDKSGKEIAQESSFDKISHTLLPGEISPYRIDFPKVKIADVKKVDMRPASLLVPASADPVIAVLNQRIEKDGRGKTVLRGELMNQSGQTVNIPHVLATFYDNAGKVVWVNDGYVDKALIPQTPVPFALELRDDLAGNVTKYRVTVNHYTRDRV